MVINNVIYQGSGIFEEVTQKGVFFFFTTFKIVIHSTLYLFHDNKMVFAVSGHQRLLILKSRLQSESVENSSWVFPVRINGITAGK